MNNQTFERKQHLFRVDIMIDESTQTMALAALLQMLNNPAVSDFRIVEGMQFGALIEKTLQERNAQPFAIPRKQNALKNPAPGDTTGPAPATNVPASPSLAGPTAAPGRSSKGKTTTPASPSQMPASTPEPAPLAMPGHQSATGSVPPGGPAPTAVPIPAPPSASKKDSTSLPSPDSAGLLNLDNLYRLKESGALVRIVVVKGKGIKLSIPCRILNFDGFGQQITIYHVDEKKVYSFSLNEIEDIIT